jgi:tRNA pseudouridine13 synthase
LKKLIRTLEALVKIIRMERHDTPLRLSTPITNTFHIRLRATQRLSQDTVTGTVTKIQQVLDEGFANLFGDQRFGIRGRNIALARELLEGKKSVTDTREIRRKLQAYGSYLFNHYLRDRLQEGKPTPME